jgi:uroporphyrinogen decarboxylase
MNSRERVIAAMRRKCPDRVPFDLTHGFTPMAFDEFRRRTGSDDPNEYFGTDTRVVWARPGKSVADYSGYHSETPVRAHIDEWGIGHLPTVSTDATHSHLEGFIYPLSGLRSAKEIANYPFPDVGAYYRHEHLASEVEDIHERGLAACACLECTIFEIAWYLRSMEDLLMDFMDNPEPAEVLLDRIVETRIQQTVHLASSGVDVLRLGDDIASQRGMLMSLPTWRKWLKPRLADVIEAARKANPDVLIFYHTDGNATAAVPDLIEIGVEILNPVQPECMDLASLKVRYGSDLSFWGTIGTQTTLPFGTTEDVRAEVKTHIAEVGSGGGLLLAPTHTIEPEVPWENVLAFVDAVKKFGVYQN